jgi:hypothetical protein
MVVGLTSGKGGCRDTGWRVVVIWEPCWELYAGIRGALNNPGRDS